MPIASVAGTVLRRRPDNAASIGRSISKAPPESPIKEESPSSNTSTRHSSAWSSSTYCRRESAWTPAAQKFLLAVVICAIFVRVILIDFPAEVVYELD